MAVIRLEATALQRLRQVLIIDDRHDLQVHKIAPLQRHFC
jgi:hypothetical protein